MPASHLSAALDFYHELHRLQTQSDEIHTALAFARRYEDLAQRVLAIRAAQSGNIFEIPPGLPLTALRSRIDNGPHFSPEQFLAAIPADCQMSPAGLLADLAGWYACQYDPAQPLNNSLQVWAGQRGDRTIRLCGTGFSSPPPPPFILLNQPPIEDWLPSGTNRPVALVAHYDVHGLAMLALTRRYLNQHGFMDVDCTLSFELTGDISKLWKRTIPRILASEREYGAVIMVDCSVHSRTPEHTLRAAARLDDAPDCHLVIIDHHSDTAGLAPELLRDRLSLALTDVPLCGLTTGGDDRARDLMTLGSLGDKMPEVSAAFPPDQAPDLHSACAEYHHRLIHFSPTPKALKQDGIMPLKPLWDALAAGRLVTGELAAEILGPLPEPERPPLPEATTCGSVVFVTERLLSVGRTWYALLERLMADAGVSYAIAVRILDNRRANMLLLTDWQAVHVPPIRHFVPVEYSARCLGHLTAVWIDVEKHEALDLLQAVAGGLNDFARTPADFTPVAVQLQQNILSSTAPDGLS